MSFNYVVYKITFPNGKIYVGSDTQRGGHHINYFGSWSCELVEKDFTREEMKNFVIRKEILFESDDKNKVLKKEIEMIRELRASEKGIGYNRKCGCGCGELK